jgi:peptide chain release factor 3
MTATTQQLQDEIRRRRTFAIISHPDAGKTTLTEKLLLYGGAIHLAGSVKARRASRHAASDWMAMEQERGISVTSSVLRFEYGGYLLNLLDTPGHQDFSEDTYRTLVAADAAVMLLDNRKGVEEQTRKLFNVCKRRRLPIFTFVNKCDRPGEEPLQLLDDVHRDLGIHCYPVTWPVRTGNRFLGVLDRTTNEVLLFDSHGDHGQTRVETRSIPMDSPELEAALPADALERLREEVELLDLAGAGMDRDAFEAGELSLTFFGSALTNFGLEPFLRHFLEWGIPPAPRESSDGVVEPTDPAFTGVVFKVQANMDPKHRDRIAFLRVCSGRFEPGMQVVIARTGKTIRVAAPQQFVARERTFLDEAWPGDVVGVHDRGSLRVGDTLSEDGGVEFLGMPRFSPEHFSSVRIQDPLKRKQLDQGLRHLSEEGAVQVFYAESHTGPAPIVGAVGVLQFDVLLHRLEHEYGVRARLEPLPYRHARWVRGDAEAIAAIARLPGRSLVHDVGGLPLILFDQEWTMQRTIQEAKGVEFLDVRP